MNQILFFINIVFLYNNKTLLLLFKNLYLTKWSNIEAHREKFPKSLIRLKICQLLLFFNYYYIVILKQYILQNSQYLLKIPNYSMIYHISVGTYSTSTLFDRSTANADTTLPSTDIFDRGTETLPLSTRWSDHQHLYHRPVARSGHRSAATRTYPPIPPTRDDRTTELCQIRPWSCASQKKPFQHISEYDYINNILIQSLSR